MISLRSIVQIQYYSLLFILLARVVIVLGETYFIILVVELVVAGISEVIIGVLVKIVRCVVHEWCLIKIDTLIFLKEAWMLIISIVKFSLRVIRSRGNLFAQ